MTSDGMKVALAELADVLEWPQGVDILDHEFRDDSQREAFVALAKYLLGYGITPLKMLESGEFQPISEKYVDYPVPSAMSPPSINGLKREVRDMLEALGDRGSDPTTLMIVRAIFVAIEANDAHHAAYLGMKFGILYQQTHLKNAEDSAIRDAKREAGRKKAVQRKADPGQVRARFHELYPDQCSKKGAAYRRLVKEFKDLELSERTIRRYVTGK